MAIKQLPVSACCFHNGRAWWMCPATCVDQQKSIALLQCGSVDMAANDSIHLGPASCLQLGVVKTIEQALPAPSAQHQFTGTRQLELPTQVLPFQAIEEANSELFGAVELHWAEFKLVTVGDQQT